MIIPVLKLGTLAIRTISKPIAARLKADAGLHPKFREFIINIAQANHRVSTTMQRRIYGRSTDVEIRPLNKERAVEAAANILGELFVFTVAGIALVYEVQRNSRAEARKEELHKQEMEAMKLKKEDLVKQVELLKQKLDDLAKTKCFLVYSSSVMPNRMKSLINPLDLIAILGGLEVICFSIDAL